MKMTMAMHQQADVVADGRICTVEEILRKYANLEQKDWGNYFLS